MSEYVGINGVPLEKKKFKHGLTKLIRDSLIPISRKLLHVHGKLNSRQWKLKPFERQLLYGKQWRKSERK
ncbi:hypothetical protein RQN30_07080 [Arcanobacterium hippocoleae]